MDAVFTWLRRAAAPASLPGPHACAAVSTMRRPGDDVSTTIDLHALVLDGVYTRDGGDAPVFHPLPGPRRRDDRRIVAALRLALERRLSLRRCRARAVHRVVAGPVAHRSGDLAVPGGALDPSRLRHRLPLPFADGTTHVELSLPELAAHLRSLTVEPRPDVTAHGMLTPKSAAAWQERGPRCDTPLQIGGPGREESEAA